MATYDGIYSGRTFYTMRLTAWESSVDTANNRSTVSWTLVAFINLDGYGGTYNLDGGTWSVTINGVPYSGHHVLDFRGASSYGYTLGIASGSTVVAHDSSGNATIGVSASDSPGVPFGTASTSGSLTLSHISLTTVPSPPPYVLNTALSSTAIRLQWGTPYNGGAAIDYYLVRVWTAGHNWDSPNVYSNTVVGNLLDIGGLTRATRYYWGVAAHNVNGYSGVVNTTTSWYVDTLATVPSTPSAPVVSSVGQARATVSFTLPDNGGSAITGTTFRAYSAATGGVLLATDDVASAVTSYTFTNLLPLTNYWVTVSATNAVGEGPESARVPVTTSPSGYVKVSGEWRPYAAYVKVAGTWRAVQESYIKVAGSWRS